MPNYLLLPLLFILPSLAAGQFEVAAVDLGRDSMHYLV